MSASYCVSPSFSPCARLLLFCLCASLAACAGSTGPTTGPANNALPPTVERGAGLPAPRDLPEPRHTAAAQLDLNGDAFDTLLPSNRLFLGDRNSAVFDANWFPGDPLDTTSYGIYSFPVAGYSGPGEIHLGWDEVTPPGKVWIGLADYATNHWNWFANPVGSVLPFDFASTNFTSPGGFVHVAVMVTVSDEYVLYTISLGDNTIPVLNFSQLFVPSNPGDVATIDVSPSYDPDGSITKFEFDPENDGSFVNKGTVPSITHKYTSSGMKSVNVRITDNDGAVVSSLYTVQVSWQHSLMGDSGENTSYAVLADVNTATILFAGTLQGLGQGDEEGYIGAYGKGGQVFWEKTWGGSGTDGLNGLARDSSGGFYACGQYDRQPDATCDGVLLKYDLAGNLSWQLKWSSTMVGQSFCLADNGGNVYYVSQLYGGGSDPDPIFIAQLDGDGNINWQHTFSAGSNVLPICCCLDTAAQNLYICGYVGGISANTDALILSLTPSGDLSFANSFDSGIDDTFESAAVSDDGNLFFAGDRSDGITIHDGLIVHCYSNGALYWAESYSMSSELETFTGPGAALLGGSVMLPGTGRDGSQLGEAMLITFGPDGSLGRQLGFGVDTAKDRGLCMALGPDGDIYLGGGLSQQTGAAFSTLSGSLGSFSSSLTPIAGASLGAVALTLSAGSGTWNDLSGETRDSGGAMLTQYLPPLGP